MAENDTEDPIVVFELPDGTEVSNDPRWLARKTLASTGVDIDAMQAKIAELQAQIDEANAASEEDDDQTNEDGDEFDKLNGKELKALAAERNVDISGMTKVGEVRDALRAAAKA